MVGKENDNNDQKKMYDYLLEVFCKDDLEKQYMIEWIAQSNIERVYKIVTGSKS